MKLKSMGLTPEEVVSERETLTSLKARLARANDRSRRDTIRKMPKHACLMGNTVAPGLPWEPFLHDPRLRSGVVFGA